jgi:5'-nucleotidase
LKAREIMAEKQLILITNDDGYEAPGYRKLIKLMRTLGDVIAISSRESMSAMSHAVTMKTPLRAKPVTEEEGFKEYITNGTPADNVKMGKHLFLSRFPDIVVSGINHGSNAAINIIYSGTVAAALEAAIDGIPAIGFSVGEYGYNIDLSHVDEYILKITNKVLNEGLPEGVALNVNFPKNNGEPLKGIKVVKQAKATWRETYEERMDPYGQKYYWMGGVFLDGDTRNDTDEKAMNNNYVAVVPVKIDFTAHELLDKLKFDD